MKDLEILEQAAAKLPDMLSTVANDEGEVDEVARTLGYARYELESALRDAFKQLKAQDDRRQETHFSRQFDWSNLGRILAAQANVQLWLEALRWSKIDKDSEPEITIEGLTLAVKNAARELLRNEGGRSTNPVSNAIDHVEGEAKADFVRKFANQLSLSIGEVFSW